MKVAESMWAIVETRGVRNPCEVTLHDTVKRTRKEAWQAAQELYAFPTGAELFADRRRDNSLRAVRVDVSWEAR